MAGIFLVFESVAGRIWKGDIPIADIEDLEKDWKYQKLSSKNQPERSIDSTKGEEFIFPVADGTPQLSGRDYEFREPTLRREPTVRSDDFSKEVQGEAGESQPAEPTDDAEAQKRLLVYPMVTSSSSSSQ